MRECTLSDSEEIVLSDCGFKSQVCSFIEGKYK